MGLLGVSVAVALHHRRGAKRDGDEVDDDEDGGRTPTMRAEPPLSGPLEAPAAESKRDPLLDEGLFALGMSAGPIAQSRPAQKRSANASRAYRPYEEEGVEGADDVVIIERVSPEEEERRYFANLAGGDDLFAGIAAPGDATNQSAGRQKPTVAYET